MRKKTCLPALVMFFLFLNVASFAAPKPGFEDWRILERANIAYEQGEFGQALALCEEAKASHLAQTTYNIENLSKALVPSEVKKEGDEIGAVYRILVKRNDIVAIAILDSIFLNHKKEYFDRSMIKLLAWLEDQRVYPEADILAGKIYQAEGENRLAMQYFEKAWLYRKNLEIPDAWYDLAYLMADLAKSNQDYGTHEKYLLDILISDPVYAKQGRDSQTLQAMLRTLVDEPATDKYFLLYRHTNFVGYRSYCELADFYFYQSNRIDRALPVAAIASTLSVTQLSAAMEEKDFSYTYSGLPDLFTRIGKNSEVRDWARNKKLWDSFLLLGAILHENGQKMQSIYLLETVSIYCPDKLAVRQAQALLSGFREK